MKVFYRIFLLSMLGLFAGGCRSEHPANNLRPDRIFMLQTTLLEGKMVFVGVGGEIDGQVNPDLEAQSGNTVSVVLESSDGIPHDFAVPELNIQSQMVTGKGASTDVVIELNEQGDFTYFCTVPGHRQAGMEGRLIIN